MPPTSTISSKGQITVPLEIRHRLGLKEGDRVEFVVDNGRTIIRPRALLRIPSKNTSAHCRPLKASSKSINGSPRFATKKTDENCSRHQHPLSPLVKRSSADVIADRLAEAKQAGALLMSGVVFAELLAYPQATESFLNPFCEEAGITIDFSLQENVWREAGRRLAKHANRRGQENRFPPNGSSQTTWLVPMHSYKPTVC